MVTQKGRDRVELLYTECAAPLLGYLNRRLPTIEIAKDVAGEVWISATRAIDSLRSPAAGRSWLFSIAYHAVVNYYRTAKAAIEVVEADAPLPWALRPADSRSEPEALYEDKARVGEITQLVGTLPLLPQSVFLLMADGYNYKDIGERLHLTQPAVRVLVHRLRRYLIQGLQRQRQGLTPATARMPLRVDP